MERGAQSVEEGSEVTRCGLATSDWFATCCSRQLVVGERVFIGFRVWEFVKLRFALQKLLRNGPTINLKLTKNNRRVL